MIQLTKRLRAVFDLVNNDGTVMADIGTDHGYLAATLVASGKAIRVIAGDVHKGPLESAKKFIHQEGLEDRVECRLGNGLQVLLPNEAQTVIIGGMGGFLIADLLMEAPYLPPNLVIQPQNGQGELRQALVNLGYAPVEETLVKDMGHIYDVWRYERNVKNTINPYIAYDISDLRWIYGIVAIEREYSLWQERMERKLKQLERTLHAIGIKNMNTTSYKEKELLKQKLEDYYADYSRNDT